MKVKDYIQKGHLVLLTLLAIPIRLSGILLSLIYERLVEMGTIITAKASDLNIFVPMIMFMVLLWIIVYGFLIKGIAKSTVDHAKVKTDGRIPWLKIFLIYFSLGEIINYLICMVFPGPFKFGKLTAFPVFYVFEIFYAIPAKRYEVLLSDTESIAYTAKDFGAFSLWYLIFEIVFLAILAFVFWMCYKKAFCEYESKIMPHDKYEYAIFSFIGRFIAYVLFYFAIKNDVEVYFLPYSIIISFLIPIIVFRIYLKKKSDFPILQISDKNELKKKVFWWILPSEIANFVLSLTVFGTFRAFHFGRMLAYPAYAVFNYTYVLFSGRGEAIAAGEYAVTDYIFFLLCYLIYATAWFFAMMLMIKSKQKHDEKHKYKFS